MQRDLDHDLTSEEQTILNGHLSHCPECKDMFNRMKRLSENLAQLPKVNPPFSLVDRIMPQLQQLDEEQATRQEPLVLRDKKQRINRMLTAFGSIAAAVLLAVISWQNLPLSKTSFDTAMSGSGSSLTQMEVASIAQEDQVMEINSDANRMLMTNNYGTSDDSHEMGQTGEEGDANFQFTTSAIPLDTRSQYEVHGLSANKLLTGRHYPSPNDAYIAVIIEEDQYYQIVIVNEQGDEVYTSRAIEADDVTMIEWSDDSSQLRYETIKGEVVSLSRIYVE